MPSRPMLSVREVADLCGTRSHTVTAWIRAGHLAASDISLHAGGRPTWRIDPDDLDAFLQRRRHEAAPPKRQRRKVPRETKQYF